MKIKTGLALLSALPAALLLAGCAAPVQVVVVDPAKKCEPSAALRQACPGAMVAKDGITYRELLVNYQSDRQSLAQCAVQQADLIKALDACNDEIASHNERLAKAQAAATAAPK